MHASHFATEFARWYIGLFSMSFGVWVFFYGNYWSAAGRHFCLELRDPALKDRFARVIERREELEGSTQFGWRICGAIAAAVGIAVILNQLAPVFGYALLCVTMSVIVSQTYAMMRNRSERRAASLQPRTPTTAVPAVWYAGAAASGLLPLALVQTPGLTVGAIFVAVAIGSIIFTAAKLSTMAALLAGDDPEIEVYVDDRLRMLRVASLLLLAYGCGFVFIMMSAPVAGRGAAGYATVEIASTILMIAFATWMLATYLRKRMRATIVA